MLSIASKSLSKRLSKSFHTWQEKGYSIKALVWCWVVLLLFSLVLSILGAPFYYDFFASRNHGRHISLLYIRLFSDASIGIVYFVAACWFILNRAGRGMPLLAAFCLLCFGNNQSGFSDAYIVFNPDRPDIIASLFFLQRALTNVLCVSFILLLPNGLFKPGWSRYYAYLWIALSIVFLLFPNMPLNYMYGKTFQRYAPYSYAFLMLSYIIPIVLLLYKFIFFPHPFRRQIKWIVIGILAILFAGLIEYGMRILYSINFFPLNENGQISHVWFHTYTRPILKAIGYNVFPLAICIALNKNALWRTDPFVRRTMLYTSLTLSVVLIYFAIILSLGWLFNQGFGLTNSLVATGTVAILFHPIQQALRQRINQMLYGQRDDPYTVMTELSKGMEDSVDTHTTLNNFCESTSNVLKLPFMGIWLANTNNTAIASYGSQLNTDIIEFPLKYESERLGTLKVARRVVGEAFNQSELVLLTTIAQHISIICHNYLLAQALQNSREQIVRGREEERKRIRRDLHDGLGPTLASTALQLETARQLIYTKPEKGDIILKNLETKMSQTLTDVRSIVHDLYPSLIDQFGLEEALKQEVQTFESSTLKIDLAINGQIDNLSAATEVAIYRIIQEAIHNIHKHAQATKCSIHIDRSKIELSIQICDNGIGLSTDDTAGIGLQSIRDRVSELSGNIQFQAAIPTNPQGSQGLLTTVIFPLNKD